MFVHGGPSWLDTDRWQPDVQALADTGFAVAMVNYRGSTGFGRGWRDSLIGDIGGPELEDVNAGLGDLVDQGIADPTRAVVAGYSWGGYVTLLELASIPISGGAASQASRSATTRPATRISRLFSRRTTARSWTAVSRRTFPS